MNHFLPILLKGAGAYAPAKVLDNQHFSSYLNTTDEWIFSRTGIRERRQAAPEESTSTMAVEACRRALEDARMSISDIDVILCATATGDYPFPATACLVQAALGGDQREIPSFDVSAACAGFVCGSIAACGLLMTGGYRNALVIGAETLTRIADPEDRSTCVLFGDAAGAVVWSRYDGDAGGRGVLYSEMGSDGTLADLIWIPAGGSKLPPSRATTDERLHFMRMKGREVYKFAVVKIQELIDRALERAGLTPGDLAMVIPHQSNLRIIEAVRERLKLPESKVAINIDRYGNTSAASVVLALDEVRRSGRLRKGDVALIVVVGSGITWGVMIVRM